MAVRVATEADLPAILTLDRAAYGADRERILSRLPGFADRMVVLEASHGIAGYAAAWRTEPFMVAGPVIAPDDEGAKLLITDLAAHSTVPIRLDLDPDRTELVGWVRSHGLLPTERTVVMTRGDLTPRGVPRDLYTRFPSRWPSHQASGQRAAVGRPASARWPVIAERSEHFGHQPGSASCRR